jgi:hypothetical protein
MSPSLINVPLPDLTYPNLSQLNQILLTYHNTCGGLSGEVINIKMGNKCRHSCFFYILEVDIAMYVLKITPWIHLNTLKQTHSTQTQSAPGQVIRTYDKCESL